MIAERTWLVTKDGKYLAPRAGLLAFIGLDDVSDWLVDGPLACHDRHDAQGWADQFGGEVVASECLANLKE